MNSSRELRDEVAVFSRSTTSDLGRDLDPLDDLFGQLNRQRMVLAELDVHVRRCAGWRSPGNETSTSSPCPAAAPGNPRCRRRLVSIDVVLTKPVSWLIVTVAPGSGPLESMTLTVRPPDCAAAPVSPSSDHDRARAVRTNLMTSSCGPVLLTGPSTDESAYRELLTTPNGQGPDDSRRFRHPSRIVAVRLCTIRPTGASTVRRFLSHTLFIGEKPG